MIAVFVTGMREGRLGQSRENLIYKVSSVCINELKLNKFEAVVHVKQARSRKLLEDYALGFASMDMVDTDQGPMKWGVIELANQNKAQLVKSLCHEWTHIKQYLRKELNYNADKWHKSKITEDYANNPAEVEAFEMQEKLFQKCVDLKIV